MGPIPLIICVIACHLCHISGAGRHCNNKEHNTTCLECRQVVFVSTYQGTQENEPERQPRGGMWNLAMPTRGGQQFWTDVRNSGGWRVQRNSVTGHHRLIDAGNVRRAWGSREHCEHQLNQAVENGQVTRYSGKVVVLLHGLLRSRRSLSDLDAFLSENGYQVVPFEYASTRDPISVHAASLRQLIDELGPDVTEINFVGHSMGNIVLRHYLQDTTDSVTGRQGDPRIGRIVMLGPPNQGSGMAKILQNSFLYAVITGAPGAELGETFDSLAESLAIPNTEFGIVAGAQPDGRRGNPLIGGPDDLTVSLEEARLAGADDLYVRPLLHSTMMYQPEVMDATLSFLNNGYFVSEQERIRIPDAPQR
ncbi:MAG: alpha/beta fold hydrolase [Planctomycetota bacterium]